MIPCGIPDAGVTSLSAELGRDITVADAIEPVEAAMRRVLAGAPASAGSAA
jgi:lipoyl(octanoyl) transferase